MKHPLLQAALWITLWLQGAAMAADSVSARAVRGEVIDAQGRRIGPYSWSPYGPDAVVLANIRGSAVAIYLGHGTSMGPDGRPYRDQHKLAPLPSGALCFEDPDCSGKGYLYEPGIEARPGLGSVAIAAVGFALKRHAAGGRIQSEDVLR